MKNLLIFLSFVLPRTVTAQTYPVVQIKNPFNGSAVYSSTSTEKRTSVLKLHGSEGGSDAYGNIEGSTLAAMGLTVMNYCYFDCNRGLVDPRQTLKNVELATLFIAIEWLRSQPNSNGKVIVYGASRGAELALILASLATEFKIKIDGVIAHAPSDKYNGAYNWNWSNQACWICKLWPKQCGPQTPKTDFIWNYSCGEYDLQLIYGPNSAWLLNGVPVPSKTRIQIEVYDGPLLITVGEKDDVWPVEQTRRIEETLKAAEKKTNIHYFPNAGHGFFGQDEVNRKNLVVEFLFAN